MSAPVVKGETVDFQEVARVSRDQLRAYAEASGDPNPIHLDDDIARKMGLPGVIAHGMLTAAFIAERGRRFHGERLAGDGEAGEWKMSRFNVRFKAMTFPGDVISVGGEVKEAGDGVLSLDLQARNQRGEVTSTGVVRFSKV